MFSLVFSMHLEYKQSLITGRLVLLDDNYNLVNVYKATSGLPGYQTRNHISSKSKGAIPAAWYVDLKSFKLTCKPYYLAKPGINGNFYHILPNSVIINGISRGEFGIHRDANVPGTAGCIGIINPSAWTTFENDMLIVSKNHEYIPLQIIYSHN